MDLEEKIIFSKLTGALPIKEPDSAPAESAASERVQAVPAVAQGDNSAAQSDVTAALEIMRQTQYNYAFRMLHSDGTLLGRIIIFFKRAIRKCLKWYLEPVCFQQSDYNQAASAAVEALLEQQKAQEAEIAALKAQLEALQH